MTPAAPKLPNLADIDALPPHVTGQIVAGVLYTHARPATPHLFTEGQVNIDVSGRFGRRDGGWWIVVEPQLELGDDVLVPDLAGWRRERMPEYPLGPAFGLVPDWVCEVLSPSTQRLDRGPKREAYRMHGVRWVWLIDPLGQLIEVFRAEKSHWALAGTWGGAQMAAIPPFDEAEFDLSEWWAPGTGEPQSDSR